MKKVLPFLLGGLALLLLLVVMGTSDRRPLRRMDERITLRQRDKIPYGTRVAFELLPSLFPSAVVARENAAPGSGDSLSLSGVNQALIIVADYLEAETEELQTLSDFVDRGNYVFITARAASDDVEAFFSTSFNNYTTYFGEQKSDSLHVRLSPPVFAGSGKMYTYPGQRYDGTLSVKDSLRCLVLGRNEKGQANFVRFDKGRGSFFLHSAPLAFSNYFVLHKSNSDYYKQAVSVLPRDLQTVVWNEYYLQKPNDKKKPNWLGALMSNPPFKWGLLIGGATLLLFVLLGMRRRQRIIPPHEKPKNDSLDFVKTLGRLYYDHRDHRNLAEKMATYFLEHVRSRYKLPTHTLDNDFVRLLHYKSAYPEAETKKIVDTIQYLQTVSSIPEGELAAFHRQLEAFYQTTSHGRTANL